MRNLINALKHFFAMKMYALKKYFFGKKLASTTRHLTASVNKSQATRVRTGHPLRTSHFGTFSPVKRLRW